MKTCLILGSNSDLGQALAYVFADKGHNIILASRKINDYQKRLKSDLEIRYNVNVSNLLFNGNNFNEHIDIIDNFEELPEVVISVFGYLGDQELAIKNFEETYNIISSNYTGHVSFLNYYVQKLKPSKRGTIIGISSVAGERGRQSNYIYGSAKAAFTTYLSGLRNELSKHNIHVLTVKPGFMNTKMIKNIETPKFLTAQPQKAASLIFKAYKKQKNTIYILPIWRVIMLVIKTIPEFIFKKLNL